jgi:hypothetical protein
LYGAAIKGRDKPSEGLDETPERLGKARVLFEAMTEKRRTTIEEAQQVGDAIGIDWSRFDLDPMPWPDGRRRESGFGADPLATR